MAQVLQVSDGTITVNLLSGNLKLTSDGWKTQTSKEQVWENIELASSATDANIRSVKDDLDELAEQARVYHLDPNTADEVWFTWQSEGESAKQALVYDIESEIFANDPMSSPLLGSDVAILQVAIKRHPDYETTSATNVTTSFLSVDGGTWSIGNAVGTSPERISRLKISTSDVGYTHQRFYIGIRPLYEGVGSFVALWEAELGALITGTTIKDPDSGASASKSLECDLTETGSDGNRTHILIDDVVGSNYNHFIGRYHILARMKVASTLTNVMIELGQYWKGSHSYHGQTFIEGETSWKLYSLGTVSFPPTGDRGNIASSHADFKNCGFTIFANSVDDTGTLFIDCYYLVPAEHNLTILGANVANTPWDLDIYTDPNDQVWGLGTSTLAQGGLQISPNNWRYPVGGGLMVVVAAADSAHQLSKTVNLSIYLVPRWKTYRTT
jgi:hypothetical protein